MCSCWLVSVVFVRCATPILSRDLSSQVYKPGGGGTPLFTFTHTFTQNKKGRRIEKKEREKKREREREKGAVGEC